MTRTKINDSLKSADKSAGLIRWVQCSIGRGFALSRQPRRWETLITRRLLKSFGCLARRHWNMSRWTARYTDTIELGRFVAQSSKILIFINLLENNTRQDPKSYIIFTTYTTNPTKILTSKLFCTIVLFLWNIFKNMTAISYAWN